MSSYSSLLSASAGEQIGGYVDEGDDDGMAAAASYLSSFCFDFGEEYVLAEEATTASAYPFHAEQEQQAPAPHVDHSPSPHVDHSPSPQAEADSHHSGKAASTSSEGPSRLNNINTSLTSSDARSKSSKIAFKTRSEVEVLDDGYRWRKYGKKLVKNSPNPRNYYRCSNEGCRVKKRVERDREDARFVVTTYDGVHNHLAPQPPRGCAGYSLAQTRFGEGSSPLHMEGRRCFLDTVKMHAAGAADSTTGSAPRKVERDN